MEAFVSGNVTTNPARGGVCSGSAWKSRLTEQGAHQTRHLVGVAQNRDTGLHQHLLLGHIGAFQSEVCVHDTAFGSFGVLANGGQVIDGVLEAVDISTKLSTCRTNRCQQRVNICKLSCRSIERSKTANVTFNTRDICLCINVKRLSRRNTNLEANSTCNT